LAGELLFHKKDSQDAAQASFHLNIKCMEIGCQKRAHKIRGVEGLTTIQKNKEKQYKTYSD
jgi:hypothetical protein